MAEPRSTSLKGPVYELFILPTSILSVFNCAFVLLAYPSVAAQVALLMELILTPLFLFDFAYRLFTVPSRSGYFFRDWGWADMIAIVPMLRVFRVFRIVAVVRVIRDMGGRQIIRAVLLVRASATFFVTIFMVIVVVEFAGMGVYAAEHNAPGANILSAGDAVWWGLVTITTVGYGDQYPITPAGRVVGVFLLFAGIALFSVLTGFIANSFLKPRRAAARKLEAPGSVEAQLNELRALLDDQEEQAALIRYKLDDLESALIVAPRRATAPPGEAS